MSRENVEAVLRGIAAYNAGDMTTFAAIYDPNAVMYHLEDWPEPGPSVGRDALVAEYNLLREAWNGRDRVEALSELVEVANHVVARVLWSVSGAHGPQGETEMSLVFTFRNGLVIEQQNFWNHADALDAVGLRE